MIDIKQFFYLVIGVGIGITLTLLYFLINFDSSTDKITLFGIIVNLGIVIFIATLLSKHQNNSKSLKDFFINEVKSLKGNYFCFIDDIQKNNLTKQEITSKFKVLSVDFDQLKTFIKKEFKYESTIQELNRSIHFLICDNDEFDMLKPNEKFKMVTNIEVELDKKLKNLKFIFYNLTLKINSH